MQFIHWWNNHEHLKALRLDAQALNERYPEAHIVSVGQSTAWLCYMADKCRDVFNQKARCQYISFSGRFFQPEHVQRQTKRQFFRYDDLWPTNAALNRYHNYLDEQKCTPAHIIHRFEEQGQRTILTDKIFSGCGMASFLHAWLGSSTYDPEVLGRALTIDLCYLAQDENLAKSTSMILNASPIDKADLSGITRYSPVSRAVHFSGGTAGESDVLSNSPRLVPSFDISRVGSGRLKDPQNEQMLLHIKSCIDGYINAHVKQRKALKK
jgi:hypothetical protein